MGNPEPLHGSIGGTCVGMDDNATMMQHLRGRGRDVVEGDDAAQPAMDLPGSGDAVTAFHDVVAHLDLARRSGSACRGPTGAAPGRPARRRTP